MILFPLSNLYNLKDSVFGLSIPGSYLYPSYTEIDHATYFLSPARTPSFQVRPSILPRIQALEFPLDPQISPPRLSPYCQVSLVPLPFLTAPYSVHWPMLQFCFPLLAIQNTTDSHSRSTVPPVPLFVLAAPLQATRRPGSPEDSIVRLLPCGSYPSYCIRRSPWSQAL